MKQCTKCKDFKSLECFSRDKKRVDGLQLNCKTCQGNYYAKNRQKIIEYKALHKTQKAEYDARYRKINKESISAKDKSRYESNKEHIKNTVASWQKNQGCGSNFKIAKNIRDRLRKAIKSDEKRLTVDLLGCSIEELKYFLESKFDTGMTWDNYGFYGWHIDHIKPLSSFNLSNPEELSMACHYTNLQPLWAIDNLKKAKKWEK